MSDQQYSNIKTMKIKAYLKEEKGEAEPPPEVECCKTTFKRSNPGRIKLWWLKYSNFEIDRTDEEREVSMSIGPRQSNQNHPRKATFWSIGKDAHIYIFLYTNVYHIF